MLRRATATLPGSDVHIFVLPSLGVNNDGRRYISFFGTGEGGTEKGGCCHAESLDDSGSVDVARWDQPFTVYVKKMRAKPFCNTIMDGGGWVLVRAPPAPRRAARPPYAVSRCARPPPANHLVSAGSSH